jgi:hypothetical protein
MSTDKALAHPVAHGRKDRRFQLKERPMSAPLTCGNAWLKVARSQLVKRLSYLALLFAVPGLLCALDVSACACTPEQQDRNGTLAVLGLLCVVVAGRAIGVGAGLVCCRLSTIGAVVLGVGQVSAGGIAVAAAADPRAWPAVTRFSTAGSAAALTSVLAALVVALLVGCYVTRRAAPSDQ